MNNLSGGHDELLLFGEQGKDSSEQFVHKGAHCLPVGEFFRPFLVITGFAEGLSPDSSFGHEVDILARAGVAVLGDPARREGGPGLVYFRVRAAECDEVLVFKEPVDVADLCQEVRGDDLADAIDAGEDLLLGGLGDLLPSVCDTQPFVVHSSSRTGQRLDTPQREVSNSLGVDRVGLTKGSLLELLNQHWIHDNRSMAVLQEVISQGEVAASSGCHEETGTIEILYLCEQRGKALGVHGKRTADPVFPRGREHVEGRTLLGNIDTNDRRHGRTFVMGLEELVPHPISRLTESRRFNHPMGIIGTGQTPYEAFGLKQYAARFAPK